MSILKQAYSPPVNELSGYQTFVSPKSVMGLPNGTDREPETVLPAGAASPMSVADPDTDTDTNIERLADGRAFDLHPSFGVPDHITTPRTPSLPGEQYGVPYVDGTISPHLRTMTGYKTRMPWKVEHEQHVMDRLHDKQDYKRNRNKENRKSKLWYKKVKHNPIFLRRRQKTRKNEKKYKRRLGADGVPSLPLPFLFGPNFLPATMLSVSPEGLVLFDLDGKVQPTASARVFLSVASFYEDTDIDIAFDAIDSIAGITAYADASPELIHAAATIRSVVWDNDPSFMLVCEALTGKAHLDDMSVEELDVILDGLSGGYFDTPEEMSKTAYHPQSPGVHHHHQHGINKARRHRSYMHNRAKAHRQSHMWYQRNKHKSAFKKRQHLRHQHPNQYKLRYAGDVPNILFLFRETDAYASLTALDGIADEVFVSYVFDDGKLGQMPLPRFLSSVGFLTPEDTDAFYDLIDSEYGLSAYGLTSVQRVAHTYIESMLYDQTPATELPSSWDRDQSPREMHDGESGPGQWSNLNKAPDYAETPKDYISPNDDNYGRREKLRTSHWIDKTAAKIADLFLHTDKGIQSKAKSVKTTLSRADPTNGAWTFKSPGSDGETHVTKVKVIPSTTSPNMKSVPKLDILVSCSCPFFRWQGPEHYAKANGYLLGKPRGTATNPTEKDPTGKNWLCKHAVSAIQMMSKYKIASECVVARSTSTKFIRLLDLDITTLHTLCNLVVHNSDVSSILFWEYVKSGALCPTDRTLVPRHAYHVPVGTTSSDSMEANILQYPEKVPPVILLHNRIVFGFDVVASAQAVGGLYVSSLEITELIDLISDSVE